MLLLLAVAVSATADTTVDASVDAIVNALVGHICVVSRERESAYLLGGIPSTSNFFIYHAEQAKMLVDLIFKTVVGRW